MGSIIIVIHSSACGEVHVVPEWRKDVIHIVVRRNGRIGIVDCWRTHQPDIPIGADEHRITGDTIVIECEGKKDWSSSSDSKAASSR